MHPRVLRIAGASRVYAVDASDAAKIAEKLAKANGYGDRMKVCIKPPLFMLCHMPYSCVLNPPLYTVFMY
jgi:hypothetical protein